jgi:hypothetical protein
MLILFDITQPPPRLQTLEGAQALIDVLWGTLGQMQARILELDKPRASRVGTRTLQQGLLSDTH